MRLSDVYDVADSIIGQKLSQVSGVGQVQIFGGARPAVRVELNPMVLANYGISLETVRIALGQVNSKQAKGRLDNGMIRWTLSDNDQLFGADHYRSIIVAYHNGSPVRLGDIGDVRDSVENIYNAGLINGEPCISVRGFTASLARISVKTVDNVRAAMPGYYKLPSRRPLPIKARAGPHGYDPCFRVRYSDHAAHHRRPRDFGDFRVPAECLGDDDSAL